MSFCLFNFWVECFDQITQMRAEMKKQFWIHNWKKKKLKIIQQADSPHLTTFTYFNLDLKRHTCIKFLDWFYSFNI